jgi:hypothetical protein
MAIADETARHLLRAMYDAAIVASQPAAMIHRHVPPPPAGRCVVVGAGKASAAMATALDAALLAQWGPGVAVSGVVATRHGHAAGLPAGRIAVVEAGHPVPDRHSLAAAQQIVAALHGLTAQDLVIALVSGGGSACMEWPVDGMDLADLQRLTRAMLESGASIAEINTVRRHLSRVKGGRLAALAAPAPVLTLLISDVPGDDPAAIASGPTLADGPVPPMPWQPSPATACPCPWPCWTHCALRHRSCPRRGNTASSPLHAWLCRRQRPGHGNRAWGRWCLATHWKARLVNLVAPWPALPGLLRHGVIAARARRDPVGR